MNKKIQIKQHILSRPVLLFSVGLLLYSTATADLLPNPNPVGNTINVYTPTDGGGGHINQGTINVYSTLTFPSRFSHWLNQGTYNIYNSGTVITKDRGGKNNDISGVINNNGTFFITVPGIFDNSGVFNNQGTMINDGGMYNNATGSINNTGTFIISNNGYLNNYGTFNNQGTLKGTGTFDGTLLNDMGIVAPGNPLGTMTVEGGDFTLDGSGILDIEIGGFTPGTYDLLDITGTAYLPSGNINFSFLPGYDIVADVGPGESWGLSFLHAGYIDSFNSTINYNFGNLPYFKFDVFQQGNELVFEATNLVPIPSAIILGIIGLGVAGLKLYKVA